MSDGVIETGALRKRRGDAQPTSQSLGKRRKIERSDDEVELGRFKGKTEEQSPPGQAKQPRSSVDEMELGRFEGKTAERLEAEAAELSRPPVKAEVVGPKRRKVTSDDAKVKRRRGGAEMEIASTRNVKDDAEPSRPRAKRRTHPLADNNSEPRWIGLGAHILLSVLLIALTAATFLLMPRYQMVGGPLIASPAFEDGLADWNQEGLASWDGDEPARVILESIDPDARTSLVRDIALPPGDSLLILRATVQADNVALGPEVWDRARIYLAQVGDDGEVLWKEDHNLFLLNDSTGIRNYSRAFSIPEEIGMARLGIEIKNTTGRLAVDDLELIQAERPTAFMLAAGCLLLAWFALTLYSGVRTLKGIESRRIRIWITVICVSSAVALMLPGYIYGDRAQTILYRLGYPDLDVDSIAHFLMFTVLSLLVRIGRPNDPIWLHAGAWLLIGVASEVLQLFTIDRESSLLDLGLDGVGILIGLALAEVTRHMRSLRTA